MTRKQRHPVVISSRYRCREHPDAYVTRHGTGCRACDWEAAERRGEHQNRRPQAEPWETVLTDRGDS